MFCKGVHQPAAQRSPRLRSSSDRHAIRPTGHDRHGNFLHLEAQPRANEPCCDIVRQWIGPGRSGRLNVELLQHLYRQRVVARDERDGAIVLCGLGRIAADSVEYERMSAPLVRRLGSSTFRLTPSRAHFPYTSTVFDCVAKFTAACDYDN
jgi:hypothetical protein